MRKLHSPDLSPFKKVLCLHNGAESMEKIF